MGKHTPLLLWFVTCTSAVGCGLEPAHDPETTAAYGQWDRNGPWFNRWLDLSCFAGECPAAARVNAISSRSDYAIRLGGAPACGTDPMAPTVTPVGNVADGALVVGSTLAIDDGTGPHLLAPGELVRVPGWLETSAGEQVAAVFTFIGRGYVSHPALPVLVWRQIDLTIEDAATCDELGSQVIHVAEAVGFPTSTGQGLTVRDHHFIASAAYWGDQTVGLSTKADLNLRVPARFGGPDDILVACVDGTPIPRSTLVAHATLALGAGARVTLPDSPSNPLFALETRLGEKVALHALVRGAAGQPSALCYGPGVPMLAGLAVERLAPGAVEYDRFDVFEAPLLTTAGGDLPLAHEANVAGGTATARRQAYLASSENPLAAAFAAETAARIGEQTLGGRPGAIASWTDAVTRLSAATMFVAAEPGVQDGVEDAMEAAWQASWCGDGVCGPAETPAACATDCGLPPPPVKTVAAPPM